MQEVTTYPFSNKVLSDGSKLFRRKHGFRFTSSIAAGENDFIELVAPYSLQKINLVELLSCEDGDQVDFWVLDSDTGVYQASKGIQSPVPKAPLNQFGFKTELPDGFYIDKSDYDADLIGGMIIKIIYYNNGQAAKTPKGNIVWHEVVVPT